MTPRDTGRAQFYEAERMIHRLFDGAGPTRAVRIAGTELTLPVEARFASIEAVAEHVRRVLGMASVRASFIRAAEPVAVRARRGYRSAEYRRPTGDSGGEIAVPTSPDGRWAMRELVLLHEVAHHLDDSGGAAHGRAFARTLTELVGLVLGPEAELTYRVLLADSGVG